MLGLYFIIIISISNKREVEESLMFNFEMLLQKAEGGGKLLHD